MALNGIEKRSEAKRSEGRRGEERRGEERRGEDLDLPTKVCRLYFFGSIPLAC